MAADFNHVTLVGRLAKAPEAKQTKNGKTMVTFTLANGQDYLKDGNWENRTWWINCDAFGFAADKLTKLAKGTQVLVEGSLEMSSWQDDKQEYHNRSIVHVSKVQVLEKKQSGQTQVPENQTSFSSYDSYDDTPF